MLGALPPSAIERDAVVAVVGASAALCGLVLVFLGVLVTSYQGLLGRDLSDRILNRFKRAAWLALAVFVLALVVLALGVAWLDAGGGHTFYVVVLTAFFVELGALLAVAIYSTWRVLLRG
jgi:hypothetical protein